MLEMTRFAGVAQLVERNLAKVEVAGSRPVSRSESKPFRLKSIFAKKIFYLIFISKPIGDDMEHRTESKRGRE